MADATERAVTAYFDGAAQAEQAAQELLRWDKADDVIKLGAIGILTRNSQGKLETKNLSPRNTGKGALVGLGLGALAAVLSGGLTLLPTAVAGAAGGGLAGSLSKQGARDVRRRPARAQRRSSRGGARRCWSCATITRWRSPQPC